MTVAGSPSVAPLAAVDQSQLIASLQQTLEAVNRLVEVLRAQQAGQAQAGAAALGGGPGQAPGCPCCAAQGAVAGADQVGQAPPPKGASGAPTKGGGAGGAPEAMRSDAPGSGTGSKLVDEVRKHLGKTYVYGAAGPDTFDCSGLMQYVAKQLGIDIPRVAKDQAKAGTAVEKDQLQPGDLVYFQGPGRSEVSHIGMYIGDGKFIHAPKTGDVVKVSSLSEGYYQQAYRGARRIG